MQTRRNEDINTSNNYKLINTYQNSVYERDGHSAANNISGLHKFTHGHCHIRRYLQYKTAKSQIDTHSSFWKAQNHTQTLYTDTVTPDNTCTTKLQKSQNHQTGTISLAQTPTQTLSHLTTHVP